MTRRNARGRIVQSRPRRRRAIKQDKAVMRALKGIFIGWRRRN